MTTDDLTQQIAALSQKQRMLLALKEMQSKIDSLERLRSEPIAIIGMSCRIPGGANSPDAYWELLRGGVDAISAMPGDRWDVDAVYDPDLGVVGKSYTKHGGFLDIDVYGFDPEFFGVAPREALSL